MMPSLVDKFSQEVYGAPELEPVVIELMKSKPLQRLKKIQQHGPCVLAWKHADETRYDHSVGVMLLLKKFNASLEEQIAGLLHDVSHTIFSHAIDYMHGLGGETYHEKNQDKIIRQSEIPTILKKYHFNIDQVVESDKFSLLDKDLPNLCADRVDYLFRDTYKIGLSKIFQIKKMLSALEVYQEEIIFNNQKQARVFSELFIGINKNLYTTHFSILFHKLIAEAMRLGLERAIMTEADLYSDDETVLEMLLNSGDQEIIRLIKLISKKTKIVRATKNYDYHLKAEKVRAVDPKVRIDNKISTLSKIDPEYKKLMCTSLSKQQSGFYVKIKANQRKVK